MTNDNLNQLAATLRAAGLCSSMLDARNMASSISTGVQQHHSEVESKIVKHMGTGQRPGGFEVIKESISPSMQQPQKEVFVNDSSVSEEISEEKTISSDDTQNSLSSNIPLSEIMKEVDEVVESVKAEEEEPVEPAPEPEPDKEPTPEPEPQPALTENKFSEVSEVKASEHDQKPEVSDIQPEAKQSSLSIFEDQAPVDIVVQASQEKEVLAEVEPQVEQGPSRQVYQGQPQQPKKKTYELYVDKSKPRATLTEQEKKDADITKWFYFGNK